VTWEDFSRVERQGWIFGVDDNSGIRDYVATLTRRTAISVIKAIISYVEFPLRWLKIVFWDQTICGFGCKDPHFGVILCLSSDWKMKLQPPDSSETLSTKLDGIRRQKTVIFSCSIGDNDNKNSNTLRHFLVGLSPLRQTPRTCHDYAMTVSFHIFSNSSSSLVLQSIAV
jgi:hypothetical protein